MLTLLSSHHSKSFSGESDDLVIGNLRIQVFHFCSMQERPERGDEQRI